MSNEVPAQEGCEEVARVQGELLCNTDVVVGQQDPLSPYTSLHYRCYTQTAVCLVL